MVTWLATRRLLRHFGRLITGLRLVGREHHHATAGSRSPATKSVKEIAGCFESAIPGFGIGLSLEGALAARPTMRGDLKAAVQPDHNALVSSGPTEQIRER